MLNMSEDFYKQIPRTSVKRGGYQEGFAYDGLKIIGNHFHYVFTEKEQLTSPSSPELRSALTSGMSDLIAMTYEALRVNNPWLLDIYGEICIRLIWTPPQEHVSDGEHVDFCYYTIPLMDVRGGVSCAVGKPFYSGLAEAYGYSPCRHKFRASRNSGRFYAVAFLQLPMDSIMPDGQVYCDALSSLYKKQYSAASHYNSKGEKV